MKAISIAEHSPLTTLRMASTRLTSSIISSNEKPKSRKRRCSVRVLLCKYPATCSRVTPLGQHLPHERSQTCRRLDGIGGVGRAAPP